LDVASYVVSPRISPSGKQIAFFLYTARIGDAGSVEIIDASGTRKTLSQNWTDLTGLAWTPDGKEVWVTGTRDSGAVKLFGVSLEGKEREILHVPADLMLMDIAKDGRVLLGAETWSAEINVRGPEASQEKDLSLFDFSVPQNLSRDGQWLLFNEAGEAGGPLETSYLARTDGSAPTKLSEGACNSLSPDNTIALCGLTAQPGPLVLVPTRAGTAKTLPDDHLFHSSTVGWLPDGRAVTYTASEPGHTQRVYLDGLDGRPPRAVTPEGVRSALLSPDGKKVAAAMASGKLFVYPLRGGEPHTIPDTNGQEGVVGWGRDGKSLFVLESRALPASVLRVDIETGRRQLWKTIAPAEASGADYIFPLLIGVDEKSYVYGLNRRLTNLYVVEGLK
jgi:WD40 repeat protein